MRAPTHDSTSKRMAKRKQLTCSISHTRRYIATKNIFCIVKNLTLINFKDDEGIRISPRRSGLLKLYRSCFCLFSYRRVAERRKGSRVQAKRIMKHLLPESEHENYETMWAMKKQENWLNKERKLFTMRKKNLQNELIEFFYVEFFSCLRPFLQSLIQLHRGNFYRNSTG